MDQQRIHLRADRRSFAKIANLPALARLQVRDPLVKPQGIRRLAVKTARVLRQVKHGLLGHPAYGALELTCADRSTVGIAIDATKALYIDFASRELHGGYEPAETLLIDTLLPRVRVFYDIGANWGYFTWLAATNPEFAGNIYSFEISPEMISELERIRTAARFPNVHIMPYGLSDRDGTIPITRNRNAQLTEVAPAASRNTIGASVRRLDNLGLPAPDLIKIDVKNHEGAVFEGGASTIRTHRPAVLFECRDPMSDDMAMLFSLLRGHEYLFHSLALSDTGVELTAIDVARPEKIPSPSNLFAAPRSRLSSLISA